MSFYSDRRNPTVLIRVNGADAPEFMEARLKFRWVDKIGKKQKATLTLSDPDRTFRDGKLQADDRYQIVFGFPGNTSRVRNFRLKEWQTNHDDAPHIVTLTLKDTGTPAKKFRPTNSPGQFRLPDVNEPVTEPDSEIDKTIRPRNWGYTTSSNIAKAIANRHGLRAIVDDSKDQDTYEYVQPGNVTDYGYLRRLAEIIDFEFFVEGSRMYYREKPYAEDPRRVFYYHPPGGQDTLLLKFTPKAKVTTVSVAPRAVNAQQAETPWITDFIQAVADEVSDVFNEPTSRAEELVREATEEDIPEDFSAAESIRTELEGNSSDVALNQEYTAKMALLDQHLIELRAARKELETSKKASGKVAHKQGSKKVGSHNQDDASCPANQQMAGKAPTGTTPTPGYAKFENVRDASSGYGVVGSVQASVQTTSGTEAKRKKVACAAHSKRKDRAVTASASFIGDPSLIPKVTYDFRGVGPMFEGKWYAKAVTHEIGETYRVTMDLKRGTLNKSKRGTQSAQSKAGRPSSAVFNARRGGAYSIWSQSAQDKYNAAQRQSLPGFYSQDGRWVPGPQSTAVPDR